MKCSSQKTAENRHWTSCIADFQYWLAFDFIAQLEKRLDELHLTSAQFAKMVGSSEKEISRVFSNPGKLNLHYIVQWTRAIGMKVSIVVYNDNDPKNKKGPIFADIFSTCWERQGKPNSFPV
jgi:hypothetical protein